MSRFYIEAYDSRNRRILGNLDGQMSWKGKDFRATRWYKRLPTWPTLNNRVKYYLVVNELGTVQERIINRTHEESCHG